MATNVMFGSTVRAVKNPDGSIAGLSAGGEAIQLYGGVTSHIPSENYDVVVYGATPNGLMAAIAAKNNGANVCVIEPSNHVGGEVTSGISRTDYRTYTTYRTGMNTLTAQFFRNAARAVGEDAFVALWSSHLKYPCQLFYSVFMDMLAAAGVAVHIGWRLAETDGVNIVGGEIQSCVFESGAQSVTVKARQWINAFQMPDLGRQAGITYINGREAASADEPAAGTTAASTTFTGIDPYLIEGDSGSGLLPGVTNAALPTVGSADDNGMWDCYRLTTTNDPDQMVPFEEPANYDASRYEFIGRRMAIGGAPTTLSTAFDRVTVLADGYTPGIASGKTIENWNNANIQLNMMGGQPDYWESTYAERDAYDQILRDYTLGYIWFLKNDSRTPSALKDELPNWGLLKGEPAGLQGLPPQAYRREPGRMTGKYVMNYANMAGTRVSDDPIAFGVYNSDIHVCRCWFDGTTIIAEGLASYTPPNRYPIDAGAVLPPVGTVSNFQEAHCISSTHLAWGSLRVAPTLMSVGEACGARAAIAIRKNAGVASIRSTDIADAIGLSYLPDHGVIAIDGTSNINEVGGPTTQNLTYGDVTITGRWDYSTSPIGFAGSGIFHDRATAKGTKSVVFTPDIAALGGAGLYRIYINTPSRHADDMDDSPTMPVTVLADGVTYSETIDTLRGEWIARPLGVYRFAGSGTETITISTTGTTGRSRVNAIRMERIST